MVDCILRLSQFHKPGVQLVHFPALLGSLICVRSAHRIAEISR